jgi:hypothetical protein
MEISASALRTIADWAVAGDDFLPVQLHSCPSGYARRWALGDVLATQGDAHIQVDAGGAIKEVVPLAVVVDDSTRCNG